MPGMRRDRLAPASDRPPPSRSGSDARDDTRSDSGPDDALQRAIQALLQRLRVERNCADNTVQAYRRDLDALAAFAREQGVRAWPDFDTAHLRHFLRRLHQERGLSPLSVRRMLSSARALFRYLLSEGQLQANPAAGLRGPRAARKLPQVLDVDEMARLLDFAPSTPQELQDKALLELIYSSGLRRAEVCALHWIDLDLESGLLRIEQGKGGRSRDVPIGRQAQDALRALRQLPGRNVSATAPVFISRNAQAIRPDGVWRRVRAVAQRQGIDKRVYPHLLRHCCGSHFLESSGDLRGTQELLGHADMVTTQIYTHLDFQHLARVYDAAHPRARRRPVHGRGSQD